MNITNSDAPVPNVSLSEARQWLRERIEEGQKCPCCGQHTKIYKRALASSLAAALMGLYRLSRNDRQFYHVNDILAAAQLPSTVGREFSIIRYWGLTVEKQKNEDEDKRSSGYWAITDTGIAFVEKKISIQSHVHLYNAEVLGFGEERVTIDDCLRKKFSYEDLMAD